MKKVIVCGGRWYGRVAADTPREKRAEAEKRAQGERELLDQVLDREREEGRLEHVIQGGANGADLYAGAWAQRRGVPFTTVAARWELYGRSAGPIRNKEMLTHRPEYVIAFPGGNGTKDMIKQARREGVAVLHIEHGMFGRWER